MEFFMENKFNEFCSQIDMGIIQNVPLPSSLLDYSKSWPTPGYQNNHSDQKNTKDKSTPDWWTIHREPVAKWCLHSGRKPKQLFDATTVTGRANLFYFIPLKTKDFSSNSLWINQKENRLFLRLELSPLSIITILLLLLLLLHHHESLSLLQIANALYVQHYVPRRFPR